MFSTRFRYRRDLFALLAYLFLTLVLTYPLVLNFTTHVAGDGSDDPALAWNLWWVRYALFDLGQSPIYTDYMFFPIGVNLAFYTLTYLNAFLSIPFQFTLGLIPAANINLILSFTLSGFGAYLLMQYLLRRTLFTYPFPAAFAAGLLYAFSSNKFLYASLGQFNIASSQWIPFYVLFLLKAFPVRDWSIGALEHEGIGVLEHGGIGTLRRSVKYGVLLGLFLLFQALSEFIFASFLILFTLAYLGYRLVECIKSRMTHDASRLTHHASRISHPLISLLKMDFGKGGQRRPGGASILLGDTPTPPAVGTFRRNVPTKPLHPIFTLLKTAPVHALRSWVTLLTASLVFLLPMSPILTAMLADMRAEGDFIQQGLGFANSFSADVLGFFVPSHLHPLLGFLESRFAFSYINFMYLGFTALALAILALWQVKPARGWGIAFVIILLITLGPTLRVNGAEFDLPLPFDALLEIPFIKGNRYPSRWSVMLTLSFAVMVGYGMAWFLENAFQRSNVPTFRRSNVQTFQRYLLLSAIAYLLILCEHLSLPLPLSDFRIPEIYSQIAREPGNWTVMEIPLAWRNGFRVTGSYRADSQAPIDRIFMFAQWYQTAQQHPILNGNTSRNPELKFQYFSETPVLDSLIAIQTGHEIDDATRVRDGALAPRVLQFLGTRYMIWHAPFEEVNRAVANKTRAYIEEVFPVTKIHESYENGRGVVVYRVNELPTPDVIRIRADEPLARLYFGEGWNASLFLPTDNEVWAERLEARVLLPAVSPPSPARLAIQATYPGTPGPDVQHMRAILNGQPLGQVTLNELWQEYTLDIPAGVLRAGVNELVLHFARLTPTGEMYDLPKQIGDTHIWTGTNLLVRSAGEEQGAFAHIYVNGVDQSLNRRGYNLVVIDLKSGKVEARDVFDTFASAQESTRLAQFIAQLPLGKIVAGAVSDEASRALTQEAVDALFSIGAHTDLRGKFRWSHAFIGVTGARAGAGMDAASEIHVSQIILGLGVTSPHLAAAVREIRIEPAP